MGCTLPIHVLPYIANTFPLQCSTCNVTLSVEHILLHCVRYREERRPLAAYYQSHGLLLTQTTLLGDEHLDVRQQKVSVARLSDCFSSFTYGGSASVSVRLMFELHTRFLESDGKWQVEVSVYLGVTKLFSHSEGDTWQPQVADLPCRKHPDKSEGTSQFITHYGTRQIIFI
ncbi:hypothetical protein E2C01_085620 [Portunus trituberculatus]|uniref:Uncharacterized protein n=1 Tax=Portunus trituberculatus TaxID=210409 RepID=A0A5B7JE54_PORTR|nr:hypothetical protein [Portunus trituberculatus]